MDYNIWFETMKVIPWSVILQGFIIGIIAMIVKKYYDNISSYFMFRANKDLSKNVKVIVDGRPGYIVHVTWRFLYVKLTDTNNELIIPITRWTTYNWEVVRNGNLKSKEDK